MHGNKPADPIARLTHLGWACFGPTIVEEHRRKLRSYFTRTYRSSHVKKSVIHPQDDQLRQFWELEALGIKDTDDKTLDEKEAVAKASESIICEDGRYSVGIPWKKGEPNLENNYEMALVSLLRFRRSPVALSGDISEMFLQVGLLKDDRIYHRFLWRDLDSSREPYVYEFQRLVFGNPASPFIAQFVLQKHAKDNAEDYREAAGTVSDSMYVDDVLDSRETSKDVIELRRQLSELLGLASFRL